MPPPELTSSSPANILTWLSHHHPKQLTILQNFEIELRLGRLSTTTASSTSSPDNHHPSHDRRLVTTRTVELLRKIIGSAKWRTGAQLLLLLKGLGKELHSSAGAFREPAIGNVIRRVMCAVREEVMAVGSVAEGCHAGEEKGGGGNRGMRPSLTNVLWAHPQQVKSSRQKSTGSSSSHAEPQFKDVRSDSFSGTSDGAFGGGVPASSSLDAEYESLPPPFYENRPELRASVMEVIQEIMSDLEDLHKNINEQAISHIHADEIILTYGRSKTIELFLKAAASKNRHFLVVVCEAAPHYDGHSMAKSLSTTPNIETIVIHDAATFAIMARVNKVLLPAHAVLANGGLVAPSGSHMVALAAMENSVPVVTVTGMYKLCPTYPHEGQDTLNDLVSSSSVVSLWGGGGVVEMEDVEVVNPVHDYIPPNLISLYVTNIGGFQPSYIYRLLAEYYHSDDWESFE